MNWKVILNAAGTAAVSGGATAVAAAGATGAGLKSMGAVFLAGALAGIVNWVRKGPTAAQG